jgi:NADPH-dependent ferric siderophore reductase
VAQQKTARVVAVETVSATTRLVTLTPAEPLGFVGGQYLIVNSGITLPDGKLAKRAYSMLSPDDNQAELTFAVKQIGPASTWMHARAVGDEVPFSGPWGKLLPDDAQPRRTRVVATDTGITAALGLVRGRGFAPQLETADMVWLVSGDDYFLTEAYVRAALPAGLRWRCAPLPPVGHPERAAAALAAVGPAADVASLFLAGDGDVIYPLRDAHPGVEARLESFFNNPAKKSV